MSNPFTFKFAKRYSESPALIIRVTPLQAEAA